VVSVLSIFLMTSLSTPIWELLPVLQKVQFPFRVHAVLAVAVTALAAHGLAAAGRRPGWLDRILLAGGAVVLALGLGFTGVKAWPWFDADRETQNAYIDYGVEVLEYWPRAALERRPELASKLIDEEPMAAYARETLAELGDDPMRATVDAGTARVVVESWAPRDIRLRVLAETRASVVVGQRYLPGWTAYVGVEEMTLPVSSTERRTWPERIGGLFSLAALLVSGALTLIALSRRRRRRASAGPP
jgi:hypothetical protein